MSWRTVKLGEILTESKIESEDSDPDKRITVRLNIKGVEKRPYEIGVEGGTKYYVRKAGQFVYGKQNLFKGAFGIIPKELDGFESSLDIPTFDVSDNCLSEWIFYFFKQRDFYKSLESLATGTGSRRIQPSRLFEVEIPLPSLGEQKKIIEAFKVAEHNYEKINNELTIQQTYLQQIRQSILQEAVQGKLTQRHPQDEPAKILLNKIKERREEWLNREIEKGNTEAQRLKRKIEKEQYIAPKDDLPINWEWATLTQACCLIVDCHNKTAPYSEYGIPIIRTTNIKEGRLNTIDLKFVTEQTYTRWSKRCPPEAGDILFTREAPVGEAAIIPERYKICMGQRIMLFRPFHDLFDKRYLLIALQSKDFLGRLENNHIGMTVKHLRVGDVESAFIAVPPILEQHRIVIKVQQLMQMVNHLEQQVQQSQTQAQQLLQAVLKEAFSPKAKLYAENEMITMAAEE